MHYFVEDEIIYLFVVEMVLIQIIWVDTFIVLSILKFFPSYTLVTDFGFSV